MPLCDPCKRLQTLTRSWAWNQPIPHHLTYESLQTCADAPDGCGLCVLLRDGLLDCMTRYADVSGVLCNWAERGPVKHLGYLDRFGSSERFKIEPYHWRVHVEPNDEGSLDGLLFTRRDLYASKCAYFKLKTEIPLTPESGRIQAGKPDLALALSWLQTCISSHKECKQPPDNASPTRLLRISEPQTAPDTLTISVVDSVATQIPASYVAVSHCWGGLQPLKTTTQNYADHSRGIAFSALPKTFQDAVLVCRAFGVHYLWIDSLCIIQDSKDDWERECPRMASVYANALVTIAAADAVNCLAGFLNDYASKQAPHFDLVPESTDRSQPPQRRLWIEYPPYQQEHHSLEPRTLLSTRGWTLQERILSRRVLSFHANRMTWECDTCCCADDLHEPYDMAWTTHGQVDKTLLRNLHDAARAHQYWRRLVTDYTQRALTVPDDKLPAISGLAQAVAQRVPDEFVAGIWRRDAAAGLCWWSVHPGDHAMASFARGSCSGRSGGGTGVQQRQQQQRAPTWSWVAADCPIEFYSIVGPDSELQILSMVCPPKGPNNPFGQVGAGVLRVAGRFRQSVVCTVAGSSSSDGGGENRLEIRGRSEWGPSIGGGIVGTFRPDCLQMSRFAGMADGAEVPVATLVLGREVKGMEGKWFGVALEALPGASPQTQRYQRVGAVLGYHCSQAWYENCYYDEFEIV